MKAAGYTSFLGSELFIVNATLPARDGLPTRADKELHDIVQRSSSANSGACACVTFVHTKVRKLKTGTGLFRALLKALKIDITVEHN